SAPSSEPLSPDAQQTVTPRAAADWKAESKLVMAWAVQNTSGLPQLIEMTDGLFVASWTARVTASRNPFAVFGAKYTAIRAFGATAAATSMSSIASPSALSAVDGEFLAPSTRTATTLGTGRPSFWKYLRMSAVRNPPPSSMIPMHWPEPSAPVGKS